MQLLRPDTGRQGGFIPAQPIGRHIRGLWRVKCSGDLAGAHESRCRGQTPETIVNEPAAAYGRFDERRVFWRASGLGAGEIREPVQGWAKVHLFALPQTSLAITSRQIAMLFNVFPDEAPLGVLEVGA